MGLLVVMAAGVGVPSEDAVGVPSEDAVTWAAERTIAMHAEPAHPYVEPRCRQCPSGGGDCPQLAWARAFLAMRSQVDEP